MLRETLRHPKTYDLAARLGCSRPEALGFLTLLWDFCGDNAPQGNVGKWTNGAIAMACDFKGDPDHFVNSLTGAGWVDAVDECRLAIHDWPDHCEGFVRKKLERSKQNFLSYYEREDGLSVHAKHPACPAAVVDTVVDNGVTIPTKPNQSHPIQSQPNQRGTPPVGRSVGVLKGKISAELLRDTGWLLSWLKANGLQLEQPLIDNERNRLFVIAAAERSLEKAERSPGGFFLALICDEERGFIDQAQEERARRRLRDFENKARGSPTTGERNSGPRPIGDILQRAGT